jgi:hypothetical protein
VEGREWTWNLARYCEEKILEKGLSISSEKEL